MLQAHIMGRPSLNAFGAIVSTSHLVVKFVDIVENLVSIHGDRQTA